MDELMVFGIVALAPAYAIIWVKIADIAFKSMQSADETAVTEKTNPSIVPK